MSFNSQQLVTQKVELCFNHASSILQHDFRLPKITFKQRGKIAGCARLQINELRFNPVLLNDNLDAFLDVVVPHEVCHLLVYRLFGKVRPHGCEWQNLMQKLFNLKGQTYHQMDVSKVKGKTFNYQCECGPIELGIRRHNKVLKGEQSYICRKCRSPLTAQVPILSL
ncbi:MAG: SprT family zinc-dependent metalloprotease [Paraglaciecola sp.]|nr:SprT family zinc-dependent metalloprotease [Paraglaciecola sp.]